MKDDLAEKGTTKQVWVVFFLGGQPLMCKDFNFEIFEPRGLEPPHWLQQKIPPLLPGVDDVAVDAGAWVTMTDGVVCFLFDASPSHFREILVWSKIYPNETDEIFCLIKTNWGGSLSAIASDLPRFYFWFFQASNLMLMNRAHEWIIKLLWLTATCLMHQDSLKQIIEISSYVRQKSQIYDIQWFFEGPSKWYPLALSSLKLT